MNKQVILDELRDLLSALQRQNLTSTGQKAVTERIMQLCDMLDQLERGGK